MPAAAPLRPLRFAGRAAALLACVFGAGTALGGSDKKALDEYFKGTVMELDGKTVTLRYDFRAPEQVADFEDQRPFNLPARKGQQMRWFDEQLEIVGNSAARHRAHWDGDVTVTVTFNVDAERDVGAFLMPDDGTNDYATFTLTETYFHKWDNNPGGLNSVIKFGDQWREGDATADFTGFRYISRKPPRTKLKSGDRIRVTFAVSRGKLTMTGPDFDLKGEDMGDKKLKRSQVGFYAINGRTLIDDVEIRGALAEDWMRRENLELRVAGSVGAGAGTGALSEEEQKLLQGHSGGDLAATRALLKILQDDSRAPEVREAVREALCTGPKKAVRPLVDLLYHEREPVRADAIRIVKVLIGKDFGYKPGASEAKRSAAIKKLNEELDKNPKLLEG